MYKLSFGISFDEMEISRKKFSSLNHLFAFAKYISFERLRDTDINLYTIKDNYINSGDEEDFEFDDDDKYHFYAQGEDTEKCYSSK